MSREMFSDPTSPLNPPGGICVAPNEETLRRYEAERARMLASLVPAKCCRWWLIPYDGYSTGRCGICDKRPRVRWDAMR